MPMHRGTPFAKFPYPLMIAPALAHRRGGDVGRDVEKAARDHHCRDSLFGTGDRP